MKDVKALEMPLPFQMEGHVSHATMGNFPID